MKRSDIHPLPQFYDRYILQVEDIDVVQALTKYSDALPDIALMEELGDQRYAEDKWTVKDVWQHIIDNERIQSYRALRLARNDAQPLPGYEQEPYAANAQATDRTLQDLMEEFNIVRKASILLFKSFSDEMQMRRGICSNTDISVLALGFVIVGHQIHHQQILEARYFPLLQ